jgi:hypothetical protein
MSVGEGGVVGGDDLLHPLGTAAGRDEGIVVGVVGGKHLVGDGEVAAVADLREEATDEGLVLCRGNGSSSCVRRWTSDREPIAYPTPGGPARVSPN